MKIAIHQPNYFPWLGYFIKADCSDHFVFHDDVALNMRSYTRRCKIQSASVKEQWLSIPVSSAANEKISLTLVNNDIPWRKTHIESIQKAYEKSPFFTSVFPFIEGLIKNTAQLTNLAEINKNIVLELFQLLDIKTRISNSSDFQLPYAKQAYNIALVQKLGGTSYLSGTGAKAYQIDDVFHQASIQLDYIYSLDYLVANAPTGFNPHLSIIDALFTIGITAAKDLISSYPYG